MNDILIWIGTPKNCLRLNRQPQALLLEEQCLFQMCVLGSRNLFAAGTNGRKRFSLEQKTCLFVTMSVLANMCQYLPSILQYVFNICQYLSRYGTAYVPTYYTVQNQRRCSHRIVHSELYHGLSVCLSVYLSVCLSVCLSMYPPMYLSMYLSIFWCISFYLSFYLSTRSISVSM